MKHTEIIESRDPVQESKEGNKQESKTKKKFKIKSNFD